MSFECVLKCGKPCKSSDTIGQDKWENLESKAKNWLGLDKFGDVYNTTSWKDGPKSHYMHESCHITISSSVKLQQAHKRKNIAQCQTSSLEMQTDNALCDDETEGPLPPMLLRSSVCGPLHDKTKCVWCMQSVDKKHPNRARGKLLRLNTHSAWRSFKRHPVLIEDEQLRGRITKLVESTSALSDPFASDIMYHHTCWQKHINHTKLKPDDAMHIQNVCLSDAKNLFFRHVDSIIFTEHEIRSLQSLLAEYKRIVGDYGYAVGDVKSSYLKDLLINEYQDTIGFKERCELNKSEWVYDVGGGGDYIDAAISSLGISDEQLLQNLAPRLSKKIKDTSTVPWPPHIDHLAEGEELCELLLKLLTWLKQPKRKTVDLSPTTLSLASMVTYHITGQRTTTVINLGVNVHGMTRSKDLVETLHKSGVCISYADTLLLYDHWALLDVETSATCPQGIADGKPAIVIVDNDDFKIDTMTGNATKAHRTNVMFVQPMSYEKKTDEEPVARLIKKKEISAQLKEKCAELTQVYQYRCPPGSKSEPPTRLMVDPPVNGTALQRARSVVHALSRADNCGKRQPPHEQRVPAYSGAQSCRHPPPNKSKPYYHTTYPEAPSKSVMHDIMVKQLEAMRKKNIPFSFLVGDMPTYKTIVKLKAENLEMFQDIIPILGAFHQQMSYIYAIYKRFKGSGMADTLVTAGVVVEGSVDQALRGKHYRRGVRCILLWREALIQKRLREILEHVELSEDIKKNLDTLRNALTKNQEALQEAHGDLEDDDDMKELINRVYEKPGTDMGDFWVSFMEMSDPLVQNIDACHARNGSEYLSSTYNMLPGLMAYDNHDYGRWLPDYWAMLSLLSDEQMAFFNDHFAQSITGLPYSCQPLDLWIETTMNLNSKLKQGWLQLLQNEKQLFSTTRNANNVARVKATVNQNLKCQRRHRKHVECQPARMKKDEQAVQDLQACMKDFDAEPFDISSPTLRSLQSGLVASQELVRDLKTALPDGQAQVEILLKERVFTKIKPLTATIHRNKRRNFASDKICAPSGTPLKVADMERSGLAALLELVEGSGMIQLESALEGRVTEECLSLYNVDGSMRKTAKSKLLQLFNLDPVAEKPRDYISLVDMGLIWRLATPTPDGREARRRDGSEYRWNDYLDKICTIIRSRHADACLIILINDRYDLPFSIKDDEHDRRAAKHPHIPNVFPKPEDTFPGAAEFNKLMFNSGNKVRLQKLVKEQLITQVGQVRGGIIYCEGETSTNLSTGMVSGDYVFKHPEADTILLSAYAKLRTGNHTGAVVLDSEDTDVYVQAAYVSQQVRGDLLIKHKHTLINCRHMLSKEVADVIIPLHVITGSDHTSGFYGHGKKPVLEKVITDPEARELLGRVGENLELEDEVRADMKAFVLSYVYGENADVTCGQARASKWHKLKKKRMIRLPPDDNSLDLHVERTNYLTYCQLHYNLLEHPSPIDHGWKIGGNGKCRPVRNTLPPLPQQLIPHDCPDESSDDNSSDDESSECGDSTDSDEE